MRPPPTETASVVDIDYSSNPDLKELFASKNAGESGVLTIKYQLLSKTVDGAKLGINAVVVEGEGMDGEDDAEPDSKEPIIVAIRNATRNEKKGYRGSGPDHSGPRGEVPETVQNSLGTQSNV